MKECIYCRKEKDDNEFTLEHIIPRFLGGAYAPEVFKTHDVCRKCNSDLGLFVDAGFEKNFLVYNYLAQAAHDLFDPQNPVGHPLSCMSIANLSPPQMQEDEVCELWIGSLGEQVYWIRPKDERLYWFSGGNPRTTKTSKSRAYFLFSEQSQENPILSWCTFRDAFEGRKVKKIMCTIVDGADPKTIGFDDPDELDLERIDFFNELCSRGETRKCQLRFYLKSDLRFMAKLSIGIAYVIFGRKVLETSYMKELSKALWYKEGEDTTPRIKGTSAFYGRPDDFLKEFFGEKNAVTITIIPSGEGVVINLNISNALNWTVKCAGYDDLDEEDIKPIIEGLVIILFKPLQKGIQLTLPQFAAHKTGTSPNVALTEITSKYITRDADLYP